MLADQNFAVCMHSKFCFCVYKNKTCKHYYHIINYFLICVILLALRVLSALYHDHRYRKIPGNRCYGGLSSQYLPLNNCSECLQCIKYYMRICICVLLLHVFTNIAFDTYPLTS